jgi:hypothetical protein
LFEPYWYGDEGIYLTLGMALRKGLVFYRDIHDNKPPFLYLIAALAQTQFWFKFISLWWQAATTVAVYKLAEIIFARLPRPPDLVGRARNDEGDRGAILLVTAMFAALMTVFEGNIANGEIFMILPVTVGMLLMISQISDIRNKKSDIRYQKSEIRYFWIGVLFAAGFLFKVPAALDFLAAMVVVVGGMRKVGGVRGIGEIREVWGKISSKQ